MLTTVDSTVAPQWDLRGTRGYSLIPVTGFAQLSYLSTVLLSSLQLVLPLLPLSLLLNTKSSACSINSLSPMFAHPA